MELDLLITDNVVIKNNHIVTIPGGLDLKCKSVTLNPNSNLIIPAISKFNGEKARLKLLQLKLE